MTEQEKMDELLAFAKKLFPERTDWWVGTVQDRRTLDVVVDEDDLVLVGGSLPGRPFRPVGPYTSKE